MCQFVVLLCVFLCFLYKKETWIVQWKMCSKVHFPPVAQLNACPSFRKHDTLIELEKFIILLGLFLSSVVGRKRKRKSFSFSIEQWNEIHVCGVEKCNKTLENNNNCKTKGTFQTFFLHIYTFYCSTTYFYYYFLCFVVVVAAIS